MSVGFTRATHFRPILCAYARAREDTDRSRKQSAAGYPAAHLASQHTYHIAKATIAKSAVMATKIVKSQKLGRQSYELFMMIFFILISSILFV